jgi:hypothetical protein
MGLWLQDCEPEVIRILALKRTCVSTTKIIKEKTAGVPSILCCFPRSLFTRRRTRVASGKAVCTTQRPFWFPSSRTRPSAAPRCALESMNGSGATDGNGGLAIAVPTGGSVFDTELVDSPLFEVQSPQGRKKTLTSAPANNSCLESPTATGDGNLYGVYGASDDSLFDSDEAISKTGLVANPGSVINTADNLLQLGVGDRKILLEGQVTILPHSLRMQLGSEHYYSSAHLTRGLLDDIVSGRAFEASSTAAQEADYIRAGSHVQELRKMCDKICSVTGSLVDSLHH